MRNFIKKCFSVPQRYILAFMNFWAIFNAFQSRMCFNVAITEMVEIQYEKDINSSYYYDPNACPDENDTGILSEELLGNATSAELFNWDEKTQGLLLSAFYWGYVVLQIPGGSLADKFGGKYVLGFGILISSIFTLLIPTSAKAGYGWLLATLFMKGLAEGTIDPATDALLARWVPLQERGLLGGFVLSGSEIGTVTGVSLCGYLLHTFKKNWPLVFYVFGSFGVLWFLVWTLLGYSEPETHPFITEKEKCFLRETIGHRRKCLPPTPWLQMLKSFPLWVVILSEFGRNWAYLTMLTYLPKYMKDVLKYSIGVNGVVSSAPYIASWFVCLGGGWIGDVAIRRNWLSVTGTRKFLGFIAHSSFAIGLIGASYAGCDRTTAAVIFILTIGLGGTYNSGMGINILDLSTNYAATISAVSSTLGCLTGLIAPYLVGILTPNRTLLEWRTFFWITAAVNVFCLVIVLWGTSGEIQLWDNIDTIDFGKDDAKKKNMEFTDDHDHDHAKRYAATVNERFTPRPVA